MESGLPVRFDRGFLVDRGIGFVGKRALAMAGEVDMASSSGDGESEAFLFRDEDGVDTARRSAEALAGDETTGCRRDYRGGHVGGCGM